MPGVAHSSDEAGSSNEAGTSSVWPSPPASDCSEEGYCTAPATGGAWGYGEWDEWWYKRGRKRGRAEEEWDPDAHDSIYESSGESPEL